MSREQKRDRRYEKSARETVRLIRNFIQEVWESDPTDEFFNYTIRGIRLTAIPELPMCMYSLSDRYEEIFIEDVLSSDKIMDDLIGKFKPGENFKGERERLVSLGFIDFTGNISVRPLTDLASNIIGTSPEANILVATYAAVAVLAVTAIKREKLDTTEIFNDCMAYWLKDKGLFDSEMITAKRVRSKAIFRVGELADRITDERYEQNLVELHPRRGKTYADFKVGNIELDEFLDATTGIEPTEEFSRLIDLYEFMNGFMAESEVERIMEDTEAKKYWARAATLSMRNIRDLGLYWSFANAMYARVKRQERKLLRMEDRVRVAEEERVKSEEKEKNIKKVLRDKNEAQRETEREMKKLQSEVNRLKVLESSGVKDVKPLRAEIEKLKESVEEKVSRLLEKDRENGKLRADLERLEEKYRRVQEELSMREEEEEQKEDENVDNDIPIEAFVSAIKSKRIAIVGGDSIHVSIRELGFEDIRFISKTEVIKGNEITSCDLVVYLVKEMPHSLYYQGQSIIEGRGIKSIRYPNRTLNRLCKEMFVALYK